MKRWVDVILPLSLSQTYTYGVPEEMQACMGVGMRVIVPLGGRKFYTGIVCRWHDDDPMYPNIKPVVAVIDERATVTEGQLELWRFVSEYYCASMGDVYRAALPSALRIESESDIVLVSEMVGAGGDFTPRERAIIEVLADGERHRTAEFKAGDMRYIRRLVERGVIANNERLVDAYRPRYVAEVVLAEEYREEGKRRALLDGMRRAAKQHEALVTYMALAPEGEPVERAVLTKEYGIGNAVIKALTDKGVLVLRQRRTERIDTSSGVTAGEVVLTEAQQRAVEEIRGQWERCNTVLLHGVAASGKTEIYIRMIRECIDGGGQVLLLTPDVSMTRQMVRRLKPHFGSRMGVYHAQCSNYERVETYNHQLSEKPYDLIVGVRGAVFLPFQRLRLVIVDDEHDTAYKQTDTAPRFNGRDVAVYMAARCGARVLLGSATPSVETYANCHFGKYGMVTLGERYGGGGDVSVEVTDMQECRRQRRLKGHFSLEMIEAIRRTVGEGRQVIVFQNRRGFAPYTECHECGYVPRCPNCDVSLTVHKHSSVLSCHYCGHTEPWGSVCPQCGKPALGTRGFGTEQVEDELRELFPEVEIARLDLDTSRSTRAYERIFADIESGRTQILVGTQMVAKGLDVGNVGLVCVVNMDNLLYHADFRAYERAYQILVQAMGRVGRGGGGGRVMIQTSQPENRMIGRIVGGDYRGFFADQMVERHAFHYPPYYRLIRIMVRHADAGVCMECAERFAERLRLRFANRVLGPDAPAVGRIQNVFIQQVLLKIECSAPMAEAKRILAGEIDAMRGAKPWSGAVYVVDVDAM